MKTVTVSKMQELDRRAIQEFKMPSIVLMENAGRSVSEVVKDMVGGDLRETKIAIFCGTGNNGGDGFVVARYLSRYGANIDVYIVGEVSKIKNDPEVNLNILKKMGLRINELGGPVTLDADLVIDAIFGVGLKGIVREPARSIIAKLNRDKIPVVSIDVPSGLNADTGEILGEAIRAKKTVTMQFAKKGFFINKGPACVGELVIVDIGIPILL